MRAPFRRIYGGLRALLGETAPERRGTEESDPTPRRAPDEAPNPSELTRGEFVVEYGITRSEYLLRVLERNGGKMSQVEAAEAVGWSPPTASKRLAELEEQRDIVRRRVGKEKLVLAREVAVGDD